MAWRGFRRSILPALLACGAAWAAAFPAGGARVVVRKVETGGAAAAAGVRPGDGVAAWRRPGGSAVPVTGVFDWFWLEREEAPKGPVLLELESEGSRRWVRLGWSDWGLGIRPAPETSSGAVAAEVLAGDASPARIERAVERLLAAGEAGAAVWLAATASSRLGGDDPGTKAAAAMADRLAGTAAGVGDRRVATAARYVAVLLFEKGNRRDRARRLGERLARELEASGVAPVILGRLLAVAAELEEARGRLERAEELLARADTVLEAVAPGSALRVEALRRRASLLITLGRLGRAEKVLRTARRIVDAHGPESGSAADLCGTEAVLAYQQGRLRDAEALFRRQLELRRNQGASPDTIAATLQNLGAVAAAGRRLREAQSYLEQALAIQEREAPDSVDTAVILGNVAVVAQYRGELATSERLLERALSIYERHAPESLDVVPILINLGKLAAEQGAPDAARRWYQRGLDLTAEQAPDSDLQATLLGNLGWLERRRGNIQAALELTSRALETLRRSGSPPLRIAEEEENLGRLWIESGRPERARQLLRKALAVRRRVAPGSLDEAKSWDALAELAEEEGDVARAERLARRAVGIAGNSGPGTWTEAEILHRFAGLMHRTGRRTAAIAVAEKALAALDRQVDRLGATEAIRAGFRSRYVPWYRELERWLVAEGRAPEAYHVLERARARALVVMMAEHELLSPDTVEAGLEARRRKLAEAVDGVIERLARADPSQRRHLRSTLQQLLERLDRLAEEIRRTNPRLAGIRYPRPLELGEACGLLGQGTVGLVYSVGSGDTLVYVLGPDGLRAVRTLEPGREDLERSVALYRGLLERSPSGDDAIRVVRVAGTQLYRQLVAPVEDALGDARRIVVVPDGPLHELPFAALVDERGRYLVERWPLGGVISFTALQEIRRREVGRGGMLVAFADPSAPSEEAAAAVGGSGGGGCFGPLPGARLEVRRIAGGGLRAARVFVGPEATEAALYREAPAASVLYCATHVVLDDHLPLNSALVLAPGGDGPEPRRENGLLQAWEILERLHLQTRLVVLSGCETGLGRNLEGEGLIGLTRAFEVAGAASVLHTLWRVEDRAQAELMVRVYRGLDRGLPLAEAVRRAQLDFIRGSVTEPRPEHGVLRRILSFWHLVAPRRTVCGHPFYWASLRVEGDWR